MLEQGPSGSGRVLEPIHGRVSVADNSTSHVEEGSLVIEGDSIYRKIGMIKYTSLGQKKQ